MARNIIKILTTLCDLILFIKTVFARTSLNIVKLILRQYVIAINQMLEVFLRLLQHNVLCPKLKQRMAVTVTADRIWMSQNQARN